MKKILLLLLISISLDSFAQLKVEEGSFKKVENCVILDKRYDDNNNPMALIRIYTENIQPEQKRYFTFDSDFYTQLDPPSIAESGEIEIFATYKVKNIKLTHNFYKPIDIVIPFDLEGHCCYELVLQGPQTTPPQPIHKEFTYLIVSADQDNAVIYIDGEEVGVKESQKRFEVGTTHSWRIECELYHPETGTVTLNDKTDINKTLRPNFGYLNITTTPEQGARVFVDGNYLGVSPIKTDKLKSGSHTVRVMKEMYKMKEQSFTVTDGQTTNATLDMAANFVNVTINTDSQSDIYVDEEYKGKGRWTGRLSDGSHLFEARKSNHRTTQKNVELLLGSTKSITLEAPKPINGSIDITTTPIRAEIYIDGKNYGETPNYINEIIIGTHELKLEKQGCTTVTKTINIKEGETLTINEKMVSQQTTDNRQQTSGNVNNQTFTVKGVSFTMIAVEGGTFQMGATSEQGSDAYSDESPVHSVTLSDYYIGETEVTQELWQAVMGSNPSSFKGSNKPVEKVSWNDCQEFIRKLNQLTGKNFRLPTEAEWEYAARGGNKSKGYKYSGSNTLRKVAWYDDNSSSTTHNVKTKSANELGIYDMSGNVLEWCQDWYGDYSSSSRTNPKGSSSGSIRVGRGGSWDYYARCCRVSFRDTRNPGNGGNYLGLRLCLSQY